MYSLDEAKASQMNSIDDFMKHNKVSAPVQQSIRDFYKALWLHGKALDHSALFERLPSTLIAELSLSLKSGLIEKVPFLSQLSKPAVFAVITQLKSTQAHIEDVIYTVGERANHIYFLSSGRVLLASLSIEVSHPTPSPSPSPRGSPKKAADQNGDQNGDTKVKDTLTMVKRSRRNSADVIAKGFAAMKSRFELGQSGHFHTSPVGVAGSEAATVAYRLESKILSGDFFGSDELYTPDKARRTLAKADTFCELELLSFEAIKVLFETYAEIKHALVEHQAARRKHGEPEKSPAAQNARSRLKALSGTLSARWSGETKTSTFLASRARQQQAHVAREQVQAGALALAPAEVKGASLSPIISIGRDGPSPGSSRRVLPTTGCT
jgi:CRP-like cAMP-binding protein